MDTYCRCDGAKNLILSIRQVKSRGGNHLLFLFTAPRRSRHKRSGSENIFRSYI